MLTAKKIKYSDIEKFFPLARIQNNLKESFSGPATAPFVGRSGYPNLNAGILSLPEQNSEAWKYDQPRLWAMQNLPISSIVNYRFSLVNSRMKTAVKNSGRIAEIAQEIGLASRPVDVEINLFKKPSFNFDYEDAVTPYGPTAKLKSAKLTENPKINQQVEKVYSDVDFKANEALNYLHARGFDEHFLSRLLSVGGVGVKFERKLVPTRWSITAVDDLVGKKIISEIQELPQSDFRISFDGYLGNYYLMILLPQAWSYELFEIQLGEHYGSYSTDYENCFGRKDYAESTAGGYYACRLAVLEKLKEMKRQAGVLVFRFITNDYSVPLGVWVCREAARKSVKRSATVFASQEEMMDYVKDFVMQRFSFELSGFIRESKLLKERRGQRRLGDF
ncbi:MAG TPA: hypothetical protein VJG31_04120 [Candidatus Nanoarchaeia archaeon]|nr:hypothetical protein [Candidatus Nanoarchaeia archaeon]